MNIVYFIPVTLLVALVWLLTGNYGTMHMLTTQCLEHKVHCIVYERDYYGGIPPNASEFAGHPQYIKLMDTVNDINCTNTNKDK